MKEVAKTAEVVKIAEMKWQKKKLKRTVGYMAWGLVLYAVIGIFISIIGVVVKVCVSYPGWLNMTDQEIDEMFW